MTDNEIATIIVNTAFNIHKELGPGLFESAYESILAFELAQKGFNIERQVPIPVIWKGLILDDSFRADLVVENSVIVELKSVETLSTVHKKQVLTYLKLSGKKLGLLINFGSAFIKDGIVRLVNGLEE